MKNKKTICWLLCITMMLTAAWTLVACNAPFAPKTSYNVKSDTLYVKKVDDIPQNFVMGMDASSVLSLEAGGVKYYNFDGKEEDVFKILADNGVNTIRVRVWNDPFDKNGNGYGGGNCNIDTAVEIGKRASKYHMNLMVDFHYSDFWADPSKQLAPKAWQGMKLGDKRDAVYEYTKESLQKLSLAGVRVSIVQVGNETTTGLCGETKWYNICALMGEGSRAVREVYPKAKVAVHFANPEKVDKYRDFAKQLDNNDVDYDVFASSYYPYWHGTLENLSSILGEIATKYEKEVMVAETSYCFTLEDSDFGGNTIGGGSYDYPFTVQGQSNCVRDVIDTIAHTEGGIGVCYWEGTWITAGGKDYEANKALWEKYGSGWASSAAADYDKDVKEYGGGGSMVDNQTFFDKTGHALESLKVFALVRKGNEIEDTQDTIQDLELLYDIEQNIEIPKTTNAVLLSGKKVSVDVNWGKTDAEWATEIARMKAGGIDQTYQYTGKVGDTTVKMSIKIVARNFLTNGSFEEDANGDKVPTGWQVTENGAKKAAQLYVEDKADDSLAPGTKHFHFWADGENRINFNLEQKVQGMVEGNYKFSIAVMGSAADAGTSVIYSYLKVNGEIVETKTLAMTEWGADKWDSKWIQFTYNGTDEVVVGIHVECSGSNAWGKIDQAFVNVDSSK